MTRIKTIRQSIAARPAEYAVKAIWTAVCAALCLSIYPGYLAHGTVTSQTDSSYSTLTDALAASATAEQYFIPQDTHLDAIQIDLIFDEDGAGDASCVFSLQDEEGDLILEQSLAFAEMTSGNYYEIPIGETLDPDQIYSWKVTFPEEMDFECHAVYSGQAGSIAPENQVFLVDGSQISEESQAVCQYRYLSHIDKADIVGKYWILIFLGFLALMELTTRISRKIREG